MPAEIPLERILDATIDTILEHGYAATTTKQIARTAGIGEMTLFRRFGTKDKLLEAALRHEAARFAQEGVAYTGNLHVDLTRVVHAYARLFKRRGRFVLELTLELPRRPELAGAMLGPQQAMQNVAQLLGRYQQEGRLQGDSPWEATLALLSPVLTLGAVKSIAPLLPAAIDPDIHVQRFIAGWGSQGLTPG